MNIVKEKLETIQKNSLFFLCEPSAFARDFLHYMISIGHFYATSRYIKFREDNEYSSFLLIYIISGKLEFQTVKAKFIASDRDIVLIDCYEKHSYKARAETEFVYMHFDGNNSRALYEQLLKARGNVWKDDCFNEHVNAILKLCEDLEHNNIPNEGDVSVLIHTILCNFCKSFFTKYTMKHSPLVHKALSYLDGNYTANIGIQDIAQSCCISPQHLNKIFFKEMQVTPYAYLLNRRMILACNLLVSTDYNIEQVAQKIGYSSAYNFMNQFKKRFGMTPSEYRKSHKLSDIPYK